MVHLDQPEANAHGRWYSRGSQLPARAQPLPLALVYFVAESPEPLCVRPRRAGAGKRHHQRPLGRHGVAELARRVARLGARNADQNVLRGEEGPGGPRGGRPRRRASGLAIYIYRQWAHATQLLDKVEQTLTPKSAPSDASKIDESDPASVKENPREIRVSENDKCT
eukprot:scaffold231108_cov32-Tisochrysis_lutea.AAC.1